MEGEPLTATGSRERANNPKLKRLIADLTLDKTMPQNVQLKDSKT